MVTVPVSQPGDERPVTGYDIRLFDPLLRDLVTWGLVVAKDGEPTGRWELVEAAQRRIDEVARPARQVGRERMIYLDHRCASCRTRRTTQLRGDRYLCEECLREECLREATGDRAGA